MTTRWMERTAWVEDGVTGEGSFCDDSATSGQETENRSNLCMYGVPNVRMNKSKVVCWCGTE
jgi:hypothetical protein